MNSLTGLRFVLLLTVWASTLPVGAQTAPMLPSPVSLADVIRLAGERRDEIQAARARVRAGEQRPTIVSALADPMFSPSLDHLPFMLGGADVSFTFEQQIPLSGIRGHRRTSALADVDRLRGEANQATLDVGIQAATAFLMLQERRRTAGLIAEQISAAQMPAPAQVPRPTAWSHRVRQARAVAWDPWEEAADRSEYALAPHQRASRRRRWAGACPHRPT